MGRSFVHTLFFIFQFNLHALCATIRPLGDSGFLETLHVNISVAIPELAGLLIGTQFDPKDSSIEAKNSFRECIDLVIKPLQQEVKVGNQPVRTFYPPPFMPESCKWNFQSRREEGVHEEDFRESRLLEVLSAIKYYMTSNDIIRTVNWALYDKQTVLGKGLISDNSAGIVDRGVDDSKAGYVISS